MTLTLKDTQYLNRPKEKGSDKGLPGNEQYEPSTRNREDVRVCLCVCMCVGGTEY